MKAFFVRLSSGIVLLAVIIAAGLLGGDVLFALTLAISIIGYLEFLKVFHLENRAPGVWGFVFLESTGEGVAPPETYGPVADAGL